MRINVTVHLFRCYLQLSKMKNYLIIFILIISGCSVEQSEIKIDNTKEFRFDTIPTIAIEESILTNQEILKIRLSDNKVVSRLEQVNNYDNDIKIRLLTGYTKEDGLMDFLKDSTYYDSNGNDTLTEMYRKRKNEDWTKVQFIRKSYDLNQNLTYLCSQRTDSSNFKQEHFFKYENQLLTSETVFECSKMVKCDSIYKDIHYYDSNNTLDSTQHFIWKEDKWELFRRMKSKKPYEWEEK